MAPLTAACLSLALSMTAMAETPAQKDLVRLTERRIPMDPKLALLCSGPEQVVGPHSSPTVHLYVNQAVIDYRKLHPDAVRYPVGSVFFKEKYDADEKATLATIMTRIADHNRADDWRYELIELPSRAPSKIDAVSCRDCHERYEKQGFISKTTTDALAAFLKKPVVAPATTNKPKTE